MSSEGTAASSTLDRKITVKLTASEEQETNDHHISVGLAIHSNDGNDEELINQQHDQPTILSEEIQDEKLKILIVEEEKYNENTETQSEPTILNIIDDEKDDGKPLMSEDKPMVNESELKSNSSNNTKIYEKPVRTPRFEELTIEEEVPIRHHGDKSSSAFKERETRPIVSNDGQNNQATSNEDSEFTVTSIPSKILNFLEKMVISNKGRIEMMKSLGNLMYLGSKTRTDVDVEHENSDTLSLLNDIYETEKISTVISIIGWYQDYVSDKHKLQNKRIQADKRFSSYHKAGQYLRLLECFILLVEIIFKKRSTYGDNGKKNYWNLLIMTEVVKAIIKVLATCKSKTNTPLFLNYNVLPPDEQAMNIPMVGSLLPNMPKISPFDKEAHSLEKFASNYKKQAKPRVGSRSGRQIPSSEQLMAMFKNGNDDVPTTSELGEQLGLNTSSDKFVLLAPQTEELKGSLGKILMYIADALYSIRPVIYSYFLSKYGFKSWQPFIISLLIELASLYLTRRAIRIVKKDIKEKSPSVPSEVGSTIEEELSRRTSNLSHYLYRGPLFEIVMERIFKSILLPIFKRIPLIGASFVGYIEYIIMIQQFYFFCNPSI